MTLMATYSPDWPDLEQLVAERAKIAVAAQASNTRASYLCDWRVFTRFCDSAGRCPLPAEMETVILYLTAIMAQGRRISTAMRHLSGIQDAHRRAGLRFDREPAQAYLDAAQRLHNELPRAKRALSVAELRRMCRTEPAGACGLRNRSILTLGFSSALRRSNLVALTLEDVEFVSQGLVIRVRREKQDQEGRGRTMGVARGKSIDTCPVQTLYEWLRIRGRQPGPVYTAVTPHGRVHIRPLAAARVCAIVKAAAKRIGLDENAIGAHSLRAGFVTAAVEAGVGEFVIAEQTGHRSLDTLRRYFRRRDVFCSNASSMIGL